MTKIVRIENSDLNFNKIIVVEVWDNIPQNGPEPTLIKTEEIVYPAGLNSFTLHDSNFLIIREKDADIKFSLVKHEKKD